MPLIIKKTASLVKALALLSLLSLIVLFGSQSVLAEDKTEVDFDTMTTDFAMYCYVCHGGEDAAAGLDLTQYQAKEDLLNDLHTWTTVMRRMESGEMPPKNAMQMNIEEREAIVHWLQSTIQEEVCGDGLKPGPSTIRRLNKNEYAATVRDLLGIHFNAGSNLPADGAGGAGFDNAAETLFISPVHGERYLEAAKEALDYAAKDRDARENLIISEPDEDTSQYEAARKTIKHFASRAFRRPVKPAEIDRLMVLYHSAVERGDSFESAVFYTMQAVMISPQFLFLVEEPNARDMVMPLDDYELASRLSYFLWSSMPDEELLELAKNNRLHRQEVLQQQLVRMLHEPTFERLRGRDNILLDDRKFHEFAYNFVTQWLNIRELGRDIQPDQDLFPRYNQELESAMVYEAVFLFQDILANNLSLLHLLDSNFTYMNRQLAKHYDMEDDVETPNSQLNRVQLPPNTTRGGIITMAGTLAVSSLPHRTSPVLRGKWVLETILGTPPPPPPPDVPELPENENEHEPKTLRERLAMHRDNPACASCHDRIDPIGFGLDNFNVVGQWREEESGHPIDASGNLPSGETFNGPDELKSVLMSKKDQFIRFLTVKMLSYALGRGLVIEDQCTVDRIVQRLQENNYKAHTLVTEIIKSVPFRYKRANQTTKVTHAQEADLY